jgi:hypothetical protein
VQDFKFESMFTIAPPPAPPAPEPAKPGDSWAKKNVTLLVVICVVLACIIAVLSYCLCPRNKNKYSDELQESGHDGIDKGPI